MKRFHSVWLAIALAVIPIHSAFGHGNATQPDKGAQEPRHVQVKIKVTEKGFQPSTVRVREGDHLTLLVTRKTDKTCAKEILIPSLDTNVELPLGKTVRISLGVQPAGRIAFACGMDMIKGEIVVQE